MLHGVFLQLQPQRVSCLHPKPDMLRSFRLLLDSVSDSSVVVVFSSSNLMHGCQIAPTFFDIHIVGISLCPTVGSKDMNPSSINSDLTFSSASYRALLCNLILQGSLRVLYITTRNSSSGIIAIASDTAIKFMSHISQILRQSFQRIRNHWWL